MELSNRVETNVMYCSKRTDVEMSPWMPPCPRCPKWSRCHDLTALPPLSAVVLDLGHLPPSNPYLTASMLIAPEIRQGLAPLTAAGTRFVTAVPELAIT
jgi:hypothetical protein